MIDKHYFDDKEIQDGITAILKKDFKITEFNYESIHLPATKETEVLLIDPALSLGVIGGIFPDMRGKFKSTIESTLKKGKIVCMPWNVGGDHWSSVIFKQDESGTTHIFYQDSFGSNIHSADEGLKRLLTTAGLLEQESTTVLNLEEFLKVELFSTVPVIHNLAIHQQSDAFNCGPFTILNSCEMIKTLKSGVTKTIDKNLKNKLKLISSQNANQLRQNFQPDDKITSYSSKLPFYKTSTSALLPLLLYKIILNLKKTISKAYNKFTGKSDSHASSLSAPQEGNELKSKNTRNNNL